MTHDSLCGQRGAGDPIVEVLEAASQWYIYRGDCLDLLRSMPDACVDVVCTDPPYGIKYHSARGATIANDDAPYIWWLRDAVRVLKPTGSLLCFCRWDVQEAFRLAIKWAGLRVVSQVVWDKRQANYMWGNKQGFASQHELALFAPAPEFVFASNKRPETVVHEQRLHHERMTHPTEKPMALLRTLLGWTVKPGSVVLDPFAGSGSCGEAALSRGCRFVGAELDAQHLATARSRLERATQTLWD